MIYQVKHKRAGWLVVIVRAIDRDEARKLGEREIREYTDIINEDDIEVELLKSRGKSEILLTDASYAESNKFT